MPKGQVKDELGAFITHAKVRIEGAAEGPLAGLAFAAKDLYDVAGVITGCGNPDWIRTHEPAEMTAPAVETLLAAGATLVAKTLTDELAYSINGENHHFGTPVNVNAPGRIPGGSSSGSASAVAGGMVDFALGSDTGGSVRVPASFCGIYGLRTTHGRISLDAIQALAPSFDTVGWFARDAALYARIGRVMLDWREPAAPTRLLLPDDLWELADDAVRAELEALIPRIEDAVAPAEHVRLSATGMENWYQAFRVLQGREVWQVHGEWITDVSPDIGPGIRERLQWTSTLTEADEAAAARVRRAVIELMSELLAPGTVMAAPITPRIAPLRGLAAAELEEIRHRVMGLTCTAPMAGLPQISLPLATVEDCPVALSLLAPQGGDEMLMELAKILS